MVIRRAHLNEYPKVIEFYYSVSDSMVGSPFRPTWRRGIYPVLDDLIGNLFIAKDENDGIIGSVLVNDRQGSGYENGAWKLNTDRVAVIHLLAVTPTYQHKGVARALLDAVRNSMIGMADTIRLDTLENNIPAKRLYEGYGFHSCGDIDVEYEGVGVKKFTLYEYLI